MPRNALLKSEWRKVDQHFPVPLLSQVEQFAEEMGFPRSMGMIFVLRCGLPIARGQLRNLKASIRAAAKVRQTLPVIDAHPAWNAARRGKS
jgi:hypothetical protein